LSKEGEGPFCPILSIESFPYFYPYEQPKASGIHLISGRILLMDTERIQHIYQDAGLYLGGGIDSGVCLIPPKPGETKRYVAKFYKDHLPLSQLNLYTRITNEASHIAVAEQWNLYVDTHYGKLAVRVIPTEEILFHNNLPVGITEQVTAKSCNGIIDCEFAQPFRQLSGFINDRLGVSGVNIIPFNARVTGKHGTLFITDLCDEIMDLRVNT